MQLSFLFQPVDDLAAAAAHYAALGWEEAWRQGDHTIALQCPGLDTQLMLDDEPGWGGPGPMYLVDDVQAWLDAHPVAQVATRIADIPGGRVADIQAPGHVYYVFSVED
ncbi:hypothetical protein GCM10009846_13420 [Agrococcus versicolor]|uniref:VOC family protein n=1 Tax=Agrococcus versicolor TaxID=501482 RepID=A0ABP5MEK8_9MICO